jgi:hypothetical protein
MKTTKSTDRVKVSIEPTEVIDGASKVHRMEIHFDPNVLAEVSCTDTGVSFTVTGQDEWADFIACLMAQFA